MSSRRRSRSPERDRRSRSRSPDRSGDRGNSRYGGTHDQKDRYGGGRYGYGRDSRDDDDNGWRGRNTYDARFAYLCLLSDACLLLTVRAEHRVPQTSRDDQTSKMSEAEIKAQEVAAARKSRMAMLKRMQGKS